VARQDIPPDGLSGARSPGVAVGDPIPAPRSSGPRTRRRRSPSRSQGRAAAPRSDHHGRQSPLGQGARPDGDGRPRRRRGGDPRDHPPRRPARHRGPVSIRLQPRELGPLRRRGGGLFFLLEQVIRNETDGAEGSGRAGPAARPDRGAAARDARARSSRPWTRRPAARLAAQHRVQLLGPHGARGRRSQARLPGPRPDQIDEDVPWPPLCTRRACRTRTWSSGPAATSGSPTS
jgi:hypothetical protein